MISVKNLYKSFDGTEVLSDISLDIREGEVVAIIGPSGSGKTTLLRCMNMLEKADAGTITVDGEPMLSTINGQAQYASKEQLRAIRLKLGLVFQSFHLFPHMSVLQNITQAQIAVQGISKEQANATALSLLDKMGLRDKKDAYPQQLSGGQSQRVAIARALALSPEVLFFDEPTSALDPELTEEVMKVIRMLAAEHTTMAIVTHEMAFARDVADRIVFMDNGRIIADGSPKEILGDATNERIRAFLGRLGQG